VLAGGARAGVRTNGTIDQELGCSVVQVLKDGQVGAEWAKNEIGLSEVHARDLIRVATQFDGATSNWRTSGRALPCGASHALPNFELWETLGTTHRLTSWYYY
jgi:hypothetical protein